MAVGVKSYIELTGNYGAKVRIHYQQTYDTATNKSTVTITGIDVMSEWYYGVTYYLDGYIDIHYNNTKQTAVSMSSGSGSNRVTISALNQYYASAGPLGSASGIPHADNGTQTITISASIRGFTSDGGTGSGWTASGAYNIGLETIPRKSTLAVNNGTLGVVQELVVTRKSSNFRHTIAYSCGTSSGTICVKSNELTIPWAPPINLAGENTTGTSVSVKLTITTYDGNTSVGSNSKTITCAIPESVAPSCSIAVSDAAGLADIYGAMVEGHSRMAITIDATESYGSDISAYRVVANGAVYDTANAVTDALKSSGTLNIEATVTDRRGRVGSAVESVSVLGYSDPLVTMLKVGRCNEDGTANEDGEYVKVTFSGTATDLDSKNSVTYVLEFKQTADPLFTIVPLADLDNVFIVSDYEYIFAADSGASYDVKVTIMDDLSIGDKSTVASTGTTIMHWPANGRGMGIGKMCETDDTLDLGWDLKMNGRKISDLADPVDDGDAVPKSYADAVEGNAKSYADTVEGNAKSYADAVGTNAKGYADSLFANAKDYVIARGTSGSWTYRKWKSGLAECWCKYAVSDYSTANAWGTLYDGAAITLPSYPFTFKTAPTVLATWMQCGSSVLLEGLFNSSNTKPGTTYLARPNAAGGLNGYISVYAVGTSA